MQTDRGKRYRNATSSVLCPKTIIVSGMWAVLAVSIYYEEVAVGSV
jgi:hypothetical protein